jgi:hypothetical protein
VKVRASLVIGLAFAGLVASFGCQREDAQGGSTSGSSGVAVQVGNGVVDTSAPQRHPQPGSARWGWGDGLDPL